MDLKTLKEEYQTKILEPISDMFKSQNNNVLVVMDASSHKDDTA